MLISEALEIFRKEIDAQVGISDAEWLTHVPDLKLIHVSARHCLQEAGKPVEYNYFIIKGLLRFYYLTPEGKELNKSFYSERDMSGNLSAMILNAPSRYSIESLEPCTLLQISTRNMLGMVNNKNSTGWTRFFDHCCRMMLIRNERREAELLTLSARDRFLRFVKNRPDYIDRIPQYHIASYLGFTPVALSKNKHRWLKHAKD